MRVLGLMSGTSLDGLDMALVAFSGQKWTTIATHHISYSPEWIGLLSNAHQLSGLELTALDLSYGHWLGEQVKAFSEQHGHIDLVSSHGHTVFHQPQRRITLQIGHGQALSIASHLTVVSDFRRADVLMGGQGAPLVPRGDLDLFPEYDAWLNLGGMSNLTTRKGTRALAWDLSPCNMVLNALSRREGLAYDQDGQLARKGTFLPELAKKIEAFDYFHQKPPKSLGREWVEAHILPLFENIPTIDALHTSVEVFSNIMVRQIPDQAHAILVSGGGAHNRYLMEVLHDKCPARFVVPDKRIVDYKEAIVFAYLGYLRFMNENNVLSDVTGVRKDHSAGVLYHPH
ncbi:MAG: anhydro-N-acetylmuramic acid kinase [Cryomorphaceae bacterium]|nr:anhydro-N-acetylmuramic acid kinase [Cryomorphaceae bacterium]